MFCLLYFQQTLRDILNSQCALPNDSAFINSIAYLPIVLRRFPRSLIVMNCSELSSRICSSIYSASPLSLILRPTPFNRILNFPSRVFTCSPACKIKGRANLIGSGCDDCKQVIGANNKMSDKFTKQDLNILNS